MTKTEIKSLYFGEAEIKPELRNEPRLWDVYISQDQNAVLNSKCLSVVRHCYDTQEGYVLVRVYEGLNHDIAYEIDHRVFDNNCRLYDELGIIPRDKNIVGLLEEEIADISRKIKESTDIFRNSSSELIRQFDLELLVDNTRGTLIIPGRIVKPKYGPEYGKPIQYWEIKKRNKKWER